MHYPAVCSLRKTRASYVSRSANRTGQRQHSKLFFVNGNIVLLDWTNFFTGKDCNNSVPKIVLIVTDITNLDLEEYYGECSKFKLGAIVSQCLASTSTPRRWKYMTTDHHESGTIHVNDANMPCAETFRYLGSTITADGSLTHEITAWVNAARAKWHTVTSVLCDKINDCLKSNIYQSSSQLHFMELNVGQRQKKLNVTLVPWRQRCCSGSVVSLALTTFATMTSGSDMELLLSSMKEARLQRYGHILHANSYTIAQMEVSGKRPKSRPKQRWLDTQHGDLRITHLHPDQAPQPGEMVPEIQSSGPNHCAG